MKMRFLAAVAAGALTLAVAGAASATLQLTLGEANINFPANYGTVDVTRTSSTTAHIVFTSDISGANGFKYYFVDGGSAAVNVNAASFSFSNLTKDGTGTIVGGNPGNEDGFGSFNQTFNSSTSWPDRSHVITFDLTGVGVNWVTDSNVLTGNNNGFLAAAHIGVCQLSANPDCTTGLGAIATGFATNGGGGFVPEPATWAMMIMGFGGVGAMLRRRRPLVPAIV
jgi:hypothetical protein